MIFRDLKPQRRSKNWSDDDFGQKKRQPLNSLVSSFETVWFLLTVILCALLLFVAIGLYWSNQQNSKSRQDSQRQLRIQEMQNSISLSVIDANQHEYERSRQTANDFFKSLEHEIAQNKNSALSAQQIESMKTVLTKKEVINDLLSENNPRSQQELVQILETFRKVMRGFQPLKQ
jgi:FtsZ-interacting cell division protein ZipA